MYEIRKGLFLTLSLLLGIAIKTLTKARKDSLKVESKTWRISLPAFSAALHYGHQPHFLSMLSFKN